MSTAAELAALIGRTGQLTVRGFRALVKVKDAKHVYGRLLLKVAQHRQGDAPAVATWVNADRVQLDPEKE